MKCRLCGSKNTKVMRIARLRCGAFKNKEFTQRTYRLYGCGDCKIRFLDKFAGEDFYKEVEYRKNFDGAISMKRYWELHDEEKNEILYRIGLHTLRNKKIIDFGTGGGNFLDAVYGFASKTIAIEPAKHYHSYLQLKHEVHSFGSDFIKANQKADVVTSLSVIEHLDNPSLHIGQLYQCLNKGGRMFLKTPNFYDILNGLVGERFLEYFLRTSHSWYFCKDSLDYLFKNSSFKQYTIKGMHKYDISNLLLWLKENKPTGIGKITAFDEGFNNFYKGYLEDKGFSSHLWVEAIK